MTKRLETPTLKRYLRKNISSILLKDAAHASEDNAEEPASKKHTYCTYCPSKIRRKANATCNKCKKVICRKHNIDMCQGYHLTDFYKFLCSYRIKFF